MKTSHSVDIQNHTGVQFSDGASTIQLQGRWKKQFASEVDVNHDEARGVTTRNTNQFVLETFPFPNQFQQQSDFFQILTKSLPAFELFNHLLNLHLSNA